MEVINYARVTMPAACSIALLAFSNTINSIVPPVSTVSRVTLLLLLTYAFCFMIFVTNIIIVGLAKACRELENLTKEMGWIQVGKADFDPTLKVMGWSNAIQVKAARDKLIPKTNPEKLDSVDPLQTIGVSWAYFFTIHLTNLGKYEERLEFTNLICRIVYIIIFWIFLIPVFLGPVSIPSQQLGVANSIHFVNHTGYTIAAIWAPIIITVFIIVATLYFAFGFGEQSKLKKLIERKVKAKQEVDIKNATKGWKKSQPSKEMPTFYKAEEYRVRTARRTEFRDDIVQVMRENSLGVYVEKPKEEKKEGEGKKEKK